MQPRTQETVATRDNPDQAIDPVAKPAASLTGNMVFRRTPLGAALAPAEPTAARGASEASPEPAPAPARPDDATPADHPEERPAGRARTTVAGLRALGARLVPKPVAAEGSRRRPRWPMWGAAAAIFVFAYLGFMMAIFGGLNIVPDFLLPR